MSSESFPPRVFTSFAERNKIRAEYFKKLKLMNVTEFIANPRVRQWLPALLNGGMLLLLTAGLAQWTWLLAKPALPPHAIAPSSSPAPIGSFSLQPLVAAHLFGQVRQELAGQRLDELPLTSLNLVVTGVIASSAGGYALISINGQPQESFAVGQTVTESAVLRGVYSDRVIIQRHGVLESLLLEGADNSQTPQHMTASAVNQFNNAPAPSDHHAARHDQLNAQTNMEDLMNQATLAPSSGGGVVVRLIQPGSFYEKLKMRGGDVIKSVNGQAVDTAEDAIMLYQQLPSMGSVQIEIVRGGRSEFLNYQFAQN